MEKRGLQHIKNRTSEGGLEDNAEVNETQHIFDEYALMSGLWRILRRLESLMGWVAVASRFTQHKTTERVL
jgi:hypothetical protein